MTGKKSNDEDEPFGKVVLFECPAPYCDHMAETPERMSKHVNQQHHGEWENDDWPDPPEED